MIKMTIVSMVASIVLFASAIALGAQSPHVINDAPSFDRCDMSYDQKVCTGRAITLKNDAAKPQTVKVVCAGLDIDTQATIPAHGTTTIDLGTDRTDLIQGQCFVVAQN